MKQIPVGSNLGVIFVQIHIKWGILRKIHLEQKKMQREILTDPQTWSTRFRLSYISQNQTGEVYTLTILEQIT